MRLDGPEMIESAQSPRPMANLPLLPPGGDVSEQLHMRLMPTSFLIDAQGRVVKRHDGFTEEEEPELEREVRALMK